MDQIQEKRINAKINQEILKASEEFPMRMSQQEAGDDNSPTADPPPHMQKVIMWQIYSQQGGQPLPFALSHNKSEIEAWTRIYPIGENYDLPIFFQKLINFNATHEKEEKACEKEVENKNPNVEYVKQTEKAESMKNESEIENQEEELEKLNDSEQESVDQNQKTDIVTQNNRDEFAKQNIRKEEIVTEINTEYEFVKQMEEGIAKIDKREKETEMCDQIETMKQKKRVIMNGSQTQREQEFDNRRETHIQKVDVELYKQNELANQNHSGKDIVKRIQREIAILKQNQRENEFENQNQKEKEMESKLERVKEKETNTQVNTPIAKIPKCELQNIQQINIYNYKYQTPKSPVRRRYPNESNAVSVTSVASRPTVAFQQKTIDFDYPSRQSSPEPAISRTGLFSATPRVAARPVPVNRSWCRIPKYKKSSICESENNLN